MTLFRRMDMLTELPIFTPSFLLEDDFLVPIPTTLSLSSDIIHFLSPSDHLVQIRQHRTRHHQLLLSSLSDRVSALELALRPLTRRHVPPREGKYTWEAEVPDRRYKVVAENRGGERSVKWTAEIKTGADDVARTYSFKAVTGRGREEREGEGGSGKREKEKKREKGKGKRVVEIEEVDSDHGAVVLRQAFAKRDRCRGKRKELSPQDAAMMIQMTFKAYLIRRSQALRALRELAVAKAKLKELRILFNNFSYRRRVARDAEERQRFTERIIVVLLTVDSIEGADVMVRAAKRSMTDELEAMLDVVDPQPSGKARFAKRRTFDMPDGIIQKELAAGVAEVVQMLDQENGTFEACL